MILSHDQETDHSIEQGMTTTPLEGKVTSDVPSTVDACVIDGNFLLHALPPNLPRTYGGLARSILIQAAALSQGRIDILFDTYDTPSIKDVERINRGTAEGTYNITGPEQARPKLKDALKSTSFKRQLPLFRARECGKAECGPIIGERDLFVGFNDRCVHIASRNGQVVQEDVGSLKSNHHEADTHIILHIAAMSAQGITGNIIVRASDTDICVILLHHCQKFAAKIWMDTETGKNRRYINISTIAHQIGPEMCAALPALHAFTGCDYNSAFVRMGKIRPASNVEKSEQFKEAFSSLSRDGGCNASTVQAIEAFTCTMYGYKTATSLNRVRYQAFEKAYSPSVKSTNPFHRLKGVDASSLPPCRAEFLLHLDRSAFVAMMWSSAD